MAGDNATRLRPDEPTSAHSKPAACGAAPGLAPSCWPGCLVPGCPATAGDSRKRRQQGAPGMPAAEARSGNTSAIAGHQGMRRRRPMRPARSRTECQRSPPTQRPRPRARSEVAFGLPGNVAAARVAVNEAPAHGLRPSVLDAAHRPIRPRGDAIRCTHECYHFAPHPLSDAPN